MSAAGGSGAVKIVGAAVNYGRGRGRVRVVSGIDLVIPRGACVGLVGESGSGKSTIGRALAGLVPLSAGSITVNGTVVGGRPRRDVQMVFQDPYASLDPRRRIGQSVAEGLPPGADRHGERIGDLLEEVGLERSLVGAYPSRVSGGQRQRVALARALAADPAVLVADEITSALDASVQGAILNLVRGIQQAKGLSMLFISHNLAVVRYVSDSIAVMYCGQIVEMGPTEEILSRPEHPYTQALLASVPSLGHSRQATAAVAGTNDDPADPASPPTGCRFHPRCGVGPATHPERTICLQTDPVLQAADHRNGAACHFAQQVGGCPAAEQTREDQT